MRGMRFQVLCFLAGALMACRCSAQDIAGSTMIDVDPDTGQVTASCETDLSADAMDYYQAVVDCSVYGNGQIIQHKMSTDTRGFGGSIAAFITFQGVPGTTYTAVGQHSANLTFRWIDPDGDGGASNLDYFYIGFYEGFQETYPDYYDWGLPGPPEDTLQNNISTGNTTASATYPQTPTSLSGPDFQGVTSVTNGPVVDYYGNTIRTGYCGVYQNNASDLLDQKGGKIITSSNFTITQNFSNYSSSYGGTVPPSKTQTQNTSIQRLADTQSLGGPYPSLCLGPNDNESFDQSFTVTINGTTYPLTTVRHISKGNFNGTQNVSVTTKTP